MRKIRRNILMGIKKPECATRVCLNSQMCDLTIVRCKGTHFSANNQIFNLIFCGKYVETHKNNS